MSEDDSKAGDRTREARIRADKAKLEALLLEALESGELVEMNDAYWERFRARLVEQQGQAPANDVS